MQHVVAWLSHQNLSCDQLLRTGQVTYMTLAHVYLVSVLQLHMPQLSATSLFV